MSSYDATDERSTASDDTQAASNLAIEYRRTYHVPLDDEGALVPYGGSSRQATGSQQDDDDLSGPDHGEHVSQSHAKEEDDLLSSNLHSRRRSHFNDYDDDDDDMDLGDSFAYGESSGTITTFQPPRKTGLAPVPESQELVPLSQSQNLDLPPDDRTSPSNEQALVAQSDALVPRSRFDSFGSDENEEEDQPREVAVITPVPAGDVTKSLSLRQSRAIDAPSVAETAMRRPLETSIRRYTADSESMLASIKEQQIENSDHSRRSKETAISGWGGYDERTLTSKMYMDDDEKSLTPTEVFEDRSSSMPLPKHVTQPAELWEPEDDESTINTYGDSYWTSKYPVKKPGYSTKPKTIVEDEEENSSQGSSFRKPAPSVATSFRSRGSVSSSSHPMGSGRSQASSVVVGLVPRAGSYRRRDESHEVEVSMDGFMHQKKPIDDVALNMQSLLGTTGEYKKNKQSSIHMFLTFGGMLLLLTIITYSASQIGPFVVQPEAKTPSPSPTESTASTSGSTPSTTGSTPSTLGSTPSTPGSTPSTPGSTPSTSGSTASNQASSGGNLASDSSQNESQPSAQGDTSEAAAGNNSPATSVPGWMVNKLVDWRLPYMGKSHEIPIIWTHENSGGDIVAELLSKCGSKIIAGDGKNYDTHNDDVKDLTSKNLKLLNSDGHTYVNVDLFSIEGVNRAGKLKLTQNRVSDVIYTPLLKAATDKLFPLKSGGTSPEVLGRLLVVFRDPVDRALNRYEATRLLTGNHDLTLTDYYNSPIYSENNPMTRDLVGLTVHDHLGQEEVKAAQEAINQFVFVGLVDEIEETIARYETFFQWQTNQPIGQCQQQVANTFQNGYKVLSNYAVEDSVGYNLIVASHSIDNFVYQYAKAQFVLQGKMFKGPSGKNQ